MRRSAALGHVKTAPVAVLGYNAESGIGRIVRAVHCPALEAMGVQTAFTAHLASVLKTMALDGRGVAWLPASLVQDEMAAGLLVLADDERWQVPLDLRLYRNPARQSAAVEGFWAGLVV